MSSDSNNGICHFGNLKKHIAKNTLPVRRRIGVATLLSWELGFERNGDSIYPVIISDARLLHNTKARFWIYMKVNTEEIKCEGIADKNIYTLKGPEIPIQVLSNDLSIEYGIQGIALQFINNPWKFNSYYDYYNRQGEKIKISREEAYVYFIGVRRHLSFHSPFFASLPLDTEELSLEDDRTPLWTSSDIQDCFQIAHGSLPCLQSRSEISYILARAKQFQLANVVCVCDRQIIKARDDLVDMKRCIRLACEYNLRHFYINLMRRVKDAKSLRDVIEKDSLDIMPGELAKATVKLFLYGNY